MPDHLDIALAEERRRAVRALLAHPLLLPDADDFPLVRRHADWLKVWFGQFLGYRLVVEASFARLVKAGLGPGRGRPLLRTTGTFTPRMYTYVTLTVAVLLTSAEQILLSQLVTDVRAAAAEAGIDLGEAQRPAERRALGTALRQLVSWNALREDQGSVAGYADDDQAEALLTVDRDIVVHLIARPLGRATTAAEFIRHAAEPGQGGTRHLVRRRLIETPVVYLDDLTAAERAWLRREQRRDERSFADYTGLHSELRAEGAALLDPDDALTDLQFPGTGTVAQAALLTVSRLVDGLRPEPHRLAIGVPVPDGAIDRILSELVERHHRRWATRYVDDPDTLRESVIDLLSDMGLVARAAPTIADGESDEVVAAERAADARQARGAATGELLVLLAAAARYATTEAVRP